MTLMILCTDLSRGVCFISEIHSGLCGLQSNCEKKCKKIKKKWNDSNNENNDDGTNDSDNNID